MTDHVWYPGEFVVSTFDLRAKTQDRSSTRETDRSVESNHDKALASRHWHPVTGIPSLAKSNSLTLPDICDRRVQLRVPTERLESRVLVRLFTHQMSLCGTTQSQRSADINHSPGRFRGRCLGVSGYNAFVLIVTNGDYGDG